MPVSAKTLLLWPFPQANKLTRYLVTKWQKIFPAFLTFLLPSISTMHYAFRARLKPVVWQPSSKLERTTICHETQPISTIFDQEFLNLPFSNILAILAKKRQIPKKKFYTDEMFDFEIFYSKYVLKHSERIPTQRIFRPQFLDFEKIDQKFSKKFIFCLFSAK